AILKGSKQTTSGLVISRNPVDGNEVTHIKINEILNGTLYLNNGVSQIQNNEFITFSESKKGLKFTPNDGISDPGSFKIQAATGADDSHLGGAIITAQIIIDNDPPSITSSPDSIIEISKPYNYVVIAIDPNALDVLTFTVVIPQFIQPWLKVVDNQDRTATILGTPPSGSAGLYEIYIKVEDQFGEYDEQFYNLSVNELNKKPELLPFSKSIQEDETIFFFNEDFNLRFSDADGDTLYSIKVASVPQFGTLKVNGVELGLNDIIEADEINSFTYIPEKDYFGLDIFDWNASDGKDYALIPQRVSVFISSVNDPPEILNFESNPFTFEYGDESIAITDSGMVVDVDGDKIEKAVVSFTKNYIQGEDTLFYEVMEGLNYEWQDTTGVLFIRGNETAAIYQDAILSLRYVNLNRLTPSGIYREIEIVLYDSDTFSIPYLRQIDFENTFV
ncbi:MAG: hypothetical protein KAI29_05705, partial [Cyclobacteriaceae bacterium]|nr:hypothetical protein [Cyclobacteriaceae bacterium]